MTKRKRQNGGFQGQGASKRATARRETKKKVTTNRLLSIGVVVIVLGLVAAGMVGVFNGPGEGGAAQVGNIQIDTSGAEVVSLEDGASLASIEHTATDRETQFLGPDNNPDGLSLAEAGQLGGATLVWFHADW